MHHIINGKLYRPNCLKVIQNNFLLCDAGQAFFVKVTIPVSSQKITVLQTLQHFGVNKEGRALLGLVLLYTLLSSLYVNTVSEWFCS